MIFGIQHFYCNYIFIQYLFVRVITYFIYSSDKEIKKSKSPELIVAFCHYKKHAVKLVTSADVICKGSVNLTTIPFSESAEPLELPLYSRSTNKKIGSAVITIQVSII